MSVAADESPLTRAIKSFDAAEANLAKLEKCWATIASLIPSGMCFGEDPDHEEACRNFSYLRDGLPAIDGWRPECLPMGLNEIAQSRFDAIEVGEFECRVSLEEAIYEPARDLREYRSRLNKKRRQLVRDSLAGLIAEADACLNKLKQDILESPPEDYLDSTAEWEQFVNCVEQIDALLGSSVTRPEHWENIQRHYIGVKVKEFAEVKYLYWAPSKRELEAGMYGDADPLPVGVNDLAALVEEKPNGPVATKLHWERLGPEDFERLVYNLIESQKDYENPQWLTRTNATDRGRDLSVIHISVDSLCGTRRQRVIIQCRHQRDSINLKDVATLKEQMKLWEPPRVEVFVIATTSRFTTDTIDWIEKNNQADTALHIEMWPEVHMEHLLAVRPDLIAEFKLR
jgi:hypothetical protein